MFNSQYEYSQFRIWADTGGCQMLRMLTSSGGGFKIPGYWEDLKTIAKSLPEKLPDYLKGENYV